MGSRRQSILITVFGLATTGLFLAFLPSVVEGIFRLCGRDLRGLVIEPSHHVGVGFYREQGTARSVEIRDAGVDFHWAGRHLLLTRVHVGRLGIRDQTRAAAFAIQTLDSLLAVSSRKASLDIPELSIDELEYVASASSEPIVIHNLRIKRLASTPAGLHVEKAQFEGRYACAVDGEPLEVSLTLSPTVFADVQEDITWVLRLSKFHLALNARDVRELEERIRSQP